MNTQSHESGQTQAEVTHKSLGKASIYARQLAANLHSKKNAPIKSAEHTPERLAVAVDAVGRMQNEHELLGQRLSTLQTSLLTLLGDELNEVEGTSYVAKISKTPTYKLKQPDQIHTLLVSMLAKIDDQFEGQGGLFDLILQLDTETINTHFVPLLRAVFEKSEQDADASLLFLADAHNELELVKKAGHDS